MYPKIITVGREYGSGGRSIAKKLAERFSASFYDKNLIEMAAKESGLSPEFIQAADQQKTSSFLYNLYFSSQNLPVSDQVFIAEAAVIRRVAEEGPCVIVGRCANYVLRDHPDCLHLFFHAPLADRINRAKGEYRIEGDNVQSQVLRIDKARSAYYNHFTTGKWGDCRDYHLSINTSLGEDRVMDLLTAVLLREEP